MTRWTALVLVAALLTSLGCAKRYDPPMPSDRVAKKDTGQPQRSAVLHQMLDVLAVSAAIFNPSLATPLCDIDANGRCDVGDILGINARIFGQEIFCERYPQPAP